MDNVIKLKELTRGDVSFERLSHAKRVIGYNRKTNITLIHQINNLVNTGYSVKQIRAVLNTINRELQKAQAS